jgi:hypothetical protein
MFIPASVKRKRQPCSAISLKKSANKKAAVLSTAAFL